MNLSRRVVHTIRRHELLTRGGRVLVALSGGPDSVALVHLLLELQAGGELTVAGLAHFNHRLRGADADDDERFCCEMAAALGLPIEVGSADVRAAAASTGRSIEDVARERRYQFLEEAAVRLAADAVAVGHSLDDQAETFLLRLVRGAGPRGLSGILPKSGRVIRPLIDIPRADLRRYAVDRSLTWRDDASNADLTIPRNRVRHELIPYLEREFSPGISRVLAREAAIARDDERRLHEEAIDFTSSIVLITTGGEIEVDAPALTSLHPALAARVARQALTVLATGRSIGFDHVTRLLDLAAGAEGDAADLPGQRAVRRGRVVVLGAPLPRDRRPREGVENSFRIPLSIPGEVTLDTQGWAVSAERVEPSVGPAGPARGRQVTIAEEPLTFPLAIRSRRRGDRFRPLGLAHRKKLQDFLVDRKIPRESRDSLPLVVDAQDRIVWVVGESVAEDFRVTEPPRGVILLKARRLGGLG